MSGAPEILLGGLLAKDFALDQKVGQRTPHLNAIGQGHAKQGQSRHSGIVSASGQKSHISAMSATPIADIGCYLSDVCLCQKDMGGPPWTPRSRLFCLVARRARRQLAAEAMPTL
jgi:hypothetical protein